MRKDIELISHAQLINGQTESSCSCT